MQRILGHHIAQLVVVIMLTCVSSSRADDNAANSIEPKLPEFERFVQAWMDADQQPGLSIAFFQGDISWAKAFGYADLENRSPARVGSVYRLASVTKPMTAVAVLQLVERGKIDLDAPVQTYVPDFPEKPWPVTVRQLLGHLGGISHYRNDEVESHIRDPLDTREALAIFQDFDLVAKPGTKFNYSSYGYNLLGAVIEGASDQSYGEYMHEHVWDACGMCATRMDDPLAIIPYRVRGYRVVDGELENDEYVDISSRFAAGGTRSNVLDMLNFIRGLRDGKLLSPETEDQMLTTMVTRDGRATVYGMGWRTFSINGHWVVAHSGGQPETSTYLVYLPAADFAVALACNRRGASLRPIYERLHRLVFNEGFEPAVYLPDRRDRAIYAAMTAALSQGLAHFDRYGEPLSTDPEHVAAAFAFFNEVADPQVSDDDLSELEQRIEDAGHPVGDWQLKCLGSYMASALVDGAARNKNRYHGQGPLVLFADYAQYCRDAADVSPDLRFQPKFEEQLASWHDQWQQLWSDDLQTLQVTGASDVEAVRQALVPLGSTEGMRPSFDRQVVEAARLWSERGDTERAASWAQLADDLDPDNAELQCDLGDLYRRLEQYDQAETAYRRALEIDPDSRRAKFALERLEAAAAP